MSSVFSSGKFLLEMVDLENRRGEKRLVTCLPRILWDGCKPPLQASKESANLFCKNPDIKYFRFCGLYPFCPCSMKAAMDKHK